jgi:hypothetical protein
MLDLFKEETMDFGSYVKYIVIGRVVGQFNVRTKRHIFQCIRNHQDVDGDCVLTDYGITCGEFALFSTLSQQVVV